MPSASPSPTATDAATPTSAVTTAAPTSSRLLGIDALRGLAVFLMMEQHMSMWLYHPPPRKTILSDPVLAAFQAGGGVAAPLFITLAGLGTSLLIDKQLTRRTGGAIDLLLARRGVALMLFGLLLNLLTPSWFSPGSWFVLHLMGFAMALAPFWRRLPNAALLGLALAVLAGTVALQSWLDTPFALFNARMRDTSLPGGPLRLAFVEGQFPIFPWLSMFLSGMVVGRWIAAGQRARVRALAAVTLTLGASLALAYYLVSKGALPHWLLQDPWVRLIRVRGSFYPAGPAIILLLHTVVLILLGLVLRLDGRWPRTSGAWMVALGRTSLTLLILHVIVFRELSRLPILDLWQNVHSTTTTLAIVFGWTLATAWLARLWERAGYRFGAEWLLRKAGG